MRIIDAHVHLYPPEVDRDPAGWAQACGERHWAVLCTRRRRDGRPVQTLPTTAQLMAAMDAAGVERAVLLGWYWENAATCVLQNRFYAECVRAYPDRLAACATLHPNAGKPEVLDEVRRARDVGLSGLGELSPHSQGYAMDDVVFGAALELAGELGLPVNLHVADPGTRPYPGRVDTPGEDFLALAQRFPGTTFVLAHWGGMLPVVDPRFRTLRNVYYDTAASPLMYPAEVWKKTCAVIDPDRLLFGSDFPLNLYPALGQAPEMTRFVDEALAGGATDAVMGRNAARLFWPAGVGGGAETS